MAAVIIVSYMYCLFCPFFLYKVLPKFEVVIRPPPFIVVDSKVVSGLICARLVKVCPIGYIHWAFKNGKNEKPDSF